MAKSFKLENTEGEAEGSLLGLIVNGTIFFADDGFGNFISVDIRFPIAFICSY